MSKGLEDVENFEDSEAQQLGIEICNKYPPRVFQLAQCEVFMPNMMAHDKAANPVAFSQREVECWPYLEGARIDLQAYNDAGGTSIGLTRIFYYSQGEKFGQPLPWPEDKSLQKVEAEEQLITTDLMDTLKDFDGLTESERERLLMCLSWGSNINIHLCPIDRQPDNLTSYMNGLYAYLHLGIRTGAYPIFTSHVSTLIDELHKLLANKPSIRTRPIHFIVEQLD